jgi:RNA polymerase sigma-70 factor
MTDHSARLIERLGERGVVLAADPELDPLLEGLFDRAEGRLPHRPIERDAVVDRVADALLASDDTPDREALTRLNAADLYLALGLAAKDGRALEIAEAELVPVMRQAVGRIDAGPAFVDEVCRRVCDRLLGGDGATPPAISQYRGTGSLARWARIFASRIALELKRADGELDGDRELCAGASSTAGDPELETIWHACADAYRAALAEAFASLSRRERNLLRQRYHDELNIDVLGRIYRVDPSTTVRWLQQIEERLAAATHTTLMTKLAISEAQGSSMERLVARALPLSLPRMLRGGDDEHGHGRRGR